MSPRPPAGLKAAGKALWKAVMNDFDLSEHERLLLVQAARTADVLDDLAVAIASQGVVLDDGRPNPLLVETRQQKVVLSRLLASLRVPDDEDEPAGRPQRRGGSRGTYAAGGRR